MKVTASPLTWQSFYLTFFPLKPRQALWLGVFSQTESGERTLRGLRGPGSTAPAALPRSVMPSLPVDASPAAAGGTRPGTIAARVCLSLAHLPSDFSRLDWHLPLCVSAPSSYARSTQPPQPRLGPAGRWPVQRQLQPRGRRMSPAPALRRGQPSRSPHALPPAPSGPRRALNIDVPHAASCQRSLCPALMKV